MINWERLARERGFLVEEANNPEEAQRGDPKRMLSSLYASLGSIEALREELCLSRHVVRVALEKFEIPVNKQGGPQNKKLEVTEEVLDMIEANGMTSAARHFNVEYSTMYKRTKEPLRIRRERRAQSAPGELAQEGGSEIPRRDESQ